MSIIDMISRPAFLIVQWAIAALIIAAVVAVWDDLIESAARKYLKARAAVARSWEKRRWRARKRAA